MNENEMGYRGSKSDCGLLTQTVKEQRVDGSWLLAEKAESLRCTLIGFERNWTTVQRGPGFQAGPSTKIRIQLGNCQVRIPSCCGFATGPADLRRSKQIIKRFSHTSRLNP